MTDGERLRRLLAEAEGASVQMPVALRPEDLAALLRVALKAGTVIHALDHDPGPRPGPWEIRYCPNCGRDFEGPGQEVGGMGPARRRIHCGGCGADWEIARP